MGIPLQTNKMPLQPQVFIEPLQRWALEFVGPISPMSQKKKVYFSLYQLCHQMGRRKTIYQASEKSAKDFIFKYFYSF